MADLTTDDPLTGGGIPLHHARTATSRPGKIVCVGRNYREHAKELGNEVPAEPLLFFKPATSVVGDGDAVVLPPQSEQVEFEGEVGIVIGRTLSRASESDCAAGVQGVVALNDVTARDLQRKDSQWARAKGFDTFCPVGNIAEGTHDLGNLTIVTRVNGEERQRASTAEMVFPIPMLLSYISDVMTLEAGDIVATGTPAGVGRLAPGDVVEVEIVGLSKVSNSVRTRE